MHSQLKERIRLMRAGLDNAAPVAEIRAESQLFVTPAPVCDRLVTLAEISKRPPGCEGNAVSQTALHVVAAGACPLLCPVPCTCLNPCRRGQRQPQPSPSVQG
ncbi:TPA: hypothetical protein JL398_004726 [Escherichia coli]|uniref:Class I SAM-dependent methyltransferase n=1 Tax=Escherichia coli TaxID=562 RepID=A0A3G4RWP4_ECOLX|nr:class I SAM-dependent methyltransferase [Escherichia coli]HAW6017881.1 hypothetical protein [Escherichia coli]